MKDVVAEGTLVVLAVIIFGLIVGSSPTSIKSTVSGIMSNQVQELKRIP